MKKTLRSAIAGIALICSIGMASPAVAAPATSVSATATTNIGAPYSCSEESASASGQIQLILFYARAKIEVQGRTFIGHSGGFGAGAGVTVGKVIAHCGFNALFEKTDSFQINNVGGVVNVLFFGPGTQLLGTFIGGNIGLGAGVFGGSGNWNN
ncbi:VapA/VapB family virulence-associated protein [Lysinibacter sp. HNR]|uniref:VapA/VapB family virulence-associated protein n=1 Tax=Lysinibacter sp. HNR TaxID=3031408 RepID=UPI0024354EFA|nr:VapA/VapB family virulence-associated protein [Lysinibacter sp. HNR]WGD36859.1 VapA/VapB family virulence-associated protein [Lysinibacter sp. HNR]